MRKLRILVALIITVMLSSQVLAATCGPFNSFPGPVSDLTTILDDDFTESLLSSETGQTATPAAGTAPTIGALGEVCSDGVRSIGDTFRQSESTSCKAITGSLRTYTDKSDDYAATLIASPTDAAIPAYLVVTDLSTGGEVCSKTITAITSTVYTDMAISDAEKIYLIGTIQASPNTLVITELSSICAEVATNTFTDTTPATSINSYPDSTVITPDGTYLVTGITRGPTEGLISVHTVTYAVTDYNTYGLDNIESAGLMTTYYDAGTDMVALATIGEGGADPDSFDITLTTISAGVLTLVTSMKSTLPVGFSDFLTLKDMTVSPNNGAIIAGGELEVGLATQGYVLSISNAGVLNFIDRVTSTSIINEITSVAASNDGNNILIGGDNPNIGNGGVIQLEPDGDKAAGYSGNFLVGVVAVLTDYNGDEVVGVGTSEFGEPGMTLLPYGLKQQTLRIKNNIQGNVPANQAPVITVDLDSTGTGVDWLIIQRMDAGFGIQIYGDNPNPDVPEFSIPTLLLATLLAGGLVLFVVRRRK